MIEQTRAIDTQADSSSDDPIPVPPLTPGSSAAILLHRIWSSAPQTVLPLLPDDRADLPAALAHLIVRADAAVSVRARVNWEGISAPDLVTAVLGDDLAAELHAARLSHGYATGYGTHACDIDSGRTRTVYAQAERRVAIIATTGTLTVEAHGLSHDIPLDIILAGQEASR